MTYTADSPLVGSGQASAAAIDAWFAAHGATRQVGASFIRWCGQFGANHDLLAAQCAHETGFLTSWWSQAPRNNTAGLGVAGAAGVGLTFASLDDSVACQVAHVLDYAAGDGAWTPYDRRRAAMLAANVGACKTLGSLDGKYAEPGVGYGQSIATLANALVASGGGAPVGRDPQATWAPSSNFDQGRNGLNVTHITDHITQGTDSLGWLRGAAGGSPSNTQSSATYLVSRDGTIHQLVDEGDTPWTDGNYPYNETCISIEHEGFSGQPLADAQILASIGLHARIAQRQGWGQLTHPAHSVEPETGPIDGNVIGHSQVPDPNAATLGGGIDHHSACPGPAFPWGQIIAGANGLLGGQPVQPVAPDVIQVNGHSLGHGFKAFWDANGGLSIFGYPITEEISENGLTVQYFERARFEWHPGSDASKYDVMLGRVGSELYALTHPTT